MSEYQEDIKDIELQDAIVEDVEVSDEENLEEAAVAPEVDGEKAAADDAAEIKKSAPPQAAAPKTKAGMINAMYSKMSKMKKEELKGAYEAMCAESVEEVEGEQIAENNFEEDLNALVESEATLSESFKGKAEVIFEAALKAKLSEHVSRLEEQYAEELAEETSRQTEELVEKVDGYLNYVVENWMEDNKIAIENGLRTEIAESFMQALHGVFTEHYIEVPESKADLVDDLATKVEDLEAQLDEAVQHNIDLKEDIAVLSRQAIISEASSDLSEAQAEKLKGLVEDIDFSDVDTFTAKVETIKESYFKKSTVEATTEEQETITEDTDVKSVSPMMEKYLAALQKSN